MWREFIMIFLWTNIKAEWIELPQFSDRSKVYRLSKPLDHNYFKLLLNDTFSNTSEIYRDELKEQIPTISSTPEVEIINEETLDQTNNRSQSTTKYINDTLKIDKNLNLIHYLPIEVFRKVHSILKSQPSSMVGKIKFLTTIERTLTSEIESRMMKVLNSNKRSTRGIHEHYEHEYEEHEEHGLGFPSVEGALMAISFLTFAVYLIRLVMMLFKNMNNTNNSNVMTSNGAAVYVGKKKRSLDPTDDYIMRIFNNMDNFETNNFYGIQSNL